MNLVIEYLGGQCPVEAGGEINGTPFYFRARGARWSMSIGLIPLEICCDEGDNGGWHREEPYGKNFEAGYMPTVEAKKIIERCAKEYLSE